MKNQAPQALLSFLASLRPKRFAEQNLGAGGIHFRRAREIRKGSRKIEDFVGKFDPDRKGDLSGSVRKMKNDLGGSCQYKNVK